MYVLCRSCDVHSLLVHEERVRGVLAEKARENKSAVESARESRAASVMMMMEEGRQMSEGEGVRGRRGGGGGREWEGKGKELMKKGGGREEGRRKMWK